MIFSRLIRLVLVAIFGISMLAAAPLYPGDAPPLGMNLGGIRDWSTEHAFVDVFKEARPWISQVKGKGWGEGGPIDLREDGYPKSIPADHWVETLFLANPHSESGQYVCLYDGKGTLEFTFDAKATDVQPGRILIDVQATNHQSGVKLLDTDPADPIHNIRILPIDHEKDYREQPFNESFMKRWSNMKVLRFMDWMETNNSPVMKWSQRATVDRLSQADDRGVALEYMIDLANRMKIDPWFCMPHQADDDFIRQFATMVKKDLAPDRKIYIEYSNECWNGQFQQARYCQQRGTEQKLSADAFQSQLFAYSKRAVEVFGIWEEDFGGTDRIVRVMASQYANPWVSEQVLTFQDAYKHCDALAVAPYFGWEFDQPDQVDATLKLCVEGLLEACAKKIDEQKATTLKIAELAKKCNVTMITYESGQHLVGVGGAENNEPLMNLFLAVNRHPRMKDLYLQDMKTWRDAGGGLFVVFASCGTYTKWGSWGVLEFDTQDATTAPKFQAVQEFSKSK